MNQGHKLSDVHPKLLISEQSNYRWRKVCGGLKTDQARKLKKLARENVRLKKAVSELAHNKMALNKALSKK